MNNFKFRQVNVQDLERCYEIETSSYAGDESASREKILKRIQQYPEGFLVMEINNQVVGFINSGATNDVQISDESFKELIGHDPAGKHVVIMSVVVHPDFQRLGYASKLMRQFINQTIRSNKLSIFLICQNELVGFYSSFGFVDKGASDSSHGGLSWREMQLNFAI